MRLFFLYTLLSAASAAPNFSLLFSGQADICKQIAGNTTGEVHYARSLNYQSAIKHYMRSSSQEPLCVVEVADPKDLSNVIKIIAATRTPFAVKSGGHASNVGFSSTTGVHISLARFNQVTLNSDKSLAEIGTGLTWTDVYEKLEKTGVNVAGGRVVGPGVGGFTLGGGYSWLTNQYGLSCDTVQAFNIVLPDGTISKVDAFQPDLFFALKGGLNRFGIVTSIVFKTFPLPDRVYGGITFYTADTVLQLLTAVNSFQQDNTDPKAAVIVTVSGGIVPFATLISFYDGPDKPAAFAPFDKINTLLSIDTIEMQSFVELSKAAPSPLNAGQRGAFHALMVTNLTPVFLEAVRNESVFYNRFALLRVGTLITWDIEPGMKYGIHATDSAFPHSTSPLPLHLYFSWLGDDQDDFWHAALQASADHLTNVAKRERIFDERDPVYPNYALSTYKGAQLYGANTERLRAVQKKVDPDRVMYLTGGFEI